MSGTPEDLLKIDAAYKAGDLEGLKALLGDPPDFPNCRGHAAVGEIVLEYAIYHSPIGFIRRLVELGADVNYGDHAGFPSLIATLSSADRPQYLEILSLLLDAGADIQQRGTNGYTPLHYAAAQNDIKAVEFLLRRGADPTARTGIDDDNTPVEEAELLGSVDAAALLRGYR